MAFYFVAVVNLEGYGKAEEELIGLDEKGTDIVVHRDRCWVGHWDRLERRVGDWELDSWEGKGESWQDVEEDWREVVFLCCHGH